jgi:hypothetical protein
VHFHDASTARFVPATKDEKRYPKGAGVVVNRTRERLALGSTTGSLWLSEDGGDSWQALSSNLPPV